MSLALKEENAHSLPLDTVLLGDSIEWMRTLPECSVDLIFADPPYNMQLSGELWRPNNTMVDAVTDEWDKFSSFSDYDLFTRDWLSAARRVMKETASLWVIGSYHNIYRVGSILMDLGFWILNDIVWIKNNPTPQMKGVRFCNAHETLLWCTKSQGNRATFNYKGLKAGNEDKQMRSDWRFPICSGRERLKIDGVKAHTTQKPEALLHRVIVSSSNPGDIILDPFCGTGTTAAVAKMLSRRYLTMDREEIYVKAARERLASINTELKLENDAVWADAPNPRIPFVTLVESGKLKAGDSLRLKEKNTLATIMEDGSLIAGNLRGSIHKVGKILMNLPACNGWAHWQYLDPVNQEWQLIDEVRKI